MASLLPITPPDTPCFHGTGCQSPCLAWPGVLVGTCAVVGSEAVLCDEVLGGEMKLSDERLAAVRSWLSSEDTPNPDSVSEKSQALLFLEDTLSHIDALTAENE